MRQKMFLILVSILCFTGCKHIKDVTKESYEAIGPNMFEHFAYFVSKNVTLREIVDVGGNLEQTGPGTVTVFNRELNLTRLTHGRLQRISDNQLEVAFEELPNKTKPTITFIQKPNSKDERYYIDFTMGEVVLVDETGTYGYIRKKGPIISYNNSRYLLIYNGEDIPYLLMDLDIKVKNENRNIRGL